MKADITRSTFRREKHYSGVRMQQGRVQMDADWNEQLDIQAYLDRSTRRDVIGLTGTRQDAGGFEIKPGDTGILIGRGHYYVNGILCENEEEIALGDQSGWLDGDWPKATGSYLAYLDVWQRHVTALEDPDIREVALGGPDTATRTKTVWQVKLLSVEDGAKCSDYGGGWVPPDAVSTGRLRARAEERGEAGDECSIPAAGGYRRRENQLYRVEIHAGGEVGGKPAPTFKWSRDNGSVVFRLEDINGNVIAVSETGQGKLHALRPGQWVELSDEERSLRGEPGILEQLDDVEGDRLTVKSWPGDETPALKDGPIVRCWDSPDEVPVTGGSYLELEDGVQVEFADGEYRSGDYWLIPARAASRGVEWPRDENGDPVFEGRHGIHHHYAPLALVKRAEEDEWDVVDWRQLFPALTDLTGLFYVGGDGQEVAPGEKLPRPLQVRVANGQWPVEGAKVRFSIVGEDGSGKLESGDESGREVVAETGPTGMVECFWYPDEVLPNQSAEAVLLDVDEGPTPLLVRFNASLSVANLVTYNAPETFQDVHTVQAALDYLHETKVNRAGDTVTGDLKVEGIVDARDIHKNGEPLGFGVSRQIYQKDHGLKVGDAIYFDPELEPEEGQEGGYRRAQSNLETTTGVFLVAEVKDESNFTLLQAGYISGLSGLKSGEYYYVSADEPGALVPDEPILGVSNPILLAVGVGEGYVLPYRPSEVGLGDGVLKVDPDAPQNAICINREGNVGIGARNPVSKLHICNHHVPDDPEHMEILLDLDSEADQNGNLIRFSGELVKDSDKYAFGLGLGGKGGKEVAEKALQVGTLDHIDVNPSRWANNWSPKVTLLNDGNMGIGTSHPCSKLDIVSDEATILRLRSNQAGQSAFQDRFSSISFQGAHHAVLHDSARIGFHHNEWYNFATDMSFWTMDSSNTLHERMRVTHTGNIGIGTPNPTHSLEVHGSLWVRNWATVGYDYAEYFESRDGKAIPSGTAVVIENGKVRRAKKNEIPIGIISVNPGVVGGVHVEWPKKYLRDEFGNLVMEEYQEEAIVSKTETVTRERQRTERKTITEDVTRTEIVFEDGKYIQKQVIETITREVEVPLFEEVDLYNETGENVIGKHHVPVMEAYEEEVEVLDENGQPVLVGSDEFVTKQRPKLNPEYDPTLEYIPREQRPEWNCVGLLGQLPLRKGQPVAPTWVKIKDISDEVELWLVK
jgi:hypothetical protein